MSLPKQTLLTGFGAFGAVVSNPTERLIAHFATEVVPGHELTTCLLPVSYRRAPEIWRAVLERGGRDGRPFDLVWMLGVAGGSAHWRVERFGRNTNEATPDCDGFSPQARIVPGAPDCLPVTIAVDSVVTAIEKIGLPASPSDTAGAYLCNHLLYTALWHLQQTGHTAQAGFLHVPADHETFGTAATSAPRFFFEQHTACLRAVLTVLL